MELRSANLIGVQPNGPAGDGEVYLATFDNGVGGINIPKRTLVDRGDALVCFGTLSGVKVENDPGEQDEWLRMLRRLCGETMERLAAEAQASLKPTSAPPLSQAQDVPLSTRSALPSLLPGESVGQAAERFERDISLRAATINESARSVEGVLASETPCAVFDWSRGEIVDEVLLVAGAAFAQQLPLLDSHNRSTVDSVMGSVRQVRVDGQQIVGTIYFSEDARAQSAFQKARGGHLDSFSIGYRVAEVVWVRPRETAVVAGRTFTAADRHLRVATRFEIKEVSIVAIGADPTARMRSETEYSVTGAPMYNRGALPKGINERMIVSAALAQRTGAVVRKPELAELAHKRGNVSLVDVALEALRIEERAGALRSPIPHDRTEMIRAATSTFALSSIVQGAVEFQLLQAYEEQEDSTAGWVEEVEVSNFRPKRIGGMNVIDTPDLLPRGGTAEHIAPQDSETDDPATKFQIARYANIFNIDEMDFIDDNVDAFVDVPQQMGRACRRLRVDLVYSLLLANGNTPDNVPLFHSSHDNLLTGGSSVLSETSLQTAVANMAKRTLDGVRLNTRAQFLIVPAEMRISAAGIVGNVQLIARQKLEGREKLTLEGLVLRSDARLGTTGVVNPTTGRLLTGTATNWIIASEPYRTLRLAFRKDTKKAPVVRSGPLSQGQWGMWTSVAFDVGAVVAGSIGLAKSNGA